MLSLTNKCSVFKKGGEGPFRLRIINKIRYDPVLSVNSGNLF